nr:MAG TPA: hypothetical protein [Caudoviricetes sp.]
MKKLQLVSSEIGQIFSIIFSKELQRFWGLLILRLDLFKVCGMDSRRSEMGLLMIS